MSEPFDLRVVSLAQVIPHEASEPRRVERMVKRLQTDDWLGNPPIVLASPADLVGDAAPAEIRDGIRAGIGGGFVLIDGANRVAALRELGYRHAIVQVASTATVRLGTWHHVLLDTTPDRLLAALRAVAAADSVELDPTGEGGVCTIRLADGRSVATRPSPGQHPFTALRPVVECYLRHAVVRRATEPDLDAFPNAAALVIFGQLTVEDVLGAVRRGALLPAGITRFVIPNRVLSLKAPLAPLRSGSSAGALSAWLDGLVESRRAAGRVRFYQEPVVVFDD